MLEGFILAIKSGGENVLLRSLKLVVAPVGYSVM
jgi:hypothetical protein